MLGICVIFGSKFRELFVPPRLPALTKENRSGH